MNTLSGAIQDVVANSLKNLRAHEVT